MQSAFELYEKRLKVKLFLLLLASLTLIFSSCGGAPEWRDEQKTNFLRSCRREAGYEKKDKCTPLAVEITERVASGSSQSCLLNEAFKIAIAIDESQEVVARQNFDKC